jgi:hypothetical protein
MAIHLSAISCEGHLSHEHLARWIYIHVYIHSCISMHVQAYMHTYVHACIHTGVAGACNVIAVHRPPHRVKSDSGVLGTVHLGELGHPLVIALQRCLQPRARGGSRTRVCHWRVPRRCRLVRRVRGRRTVRQRPVQRQRALRGKGPAARKRPLWPARGLEDGGVARLARHERCCHARAGSVCALARNLHGFRRLRTRRPGKRHRERRVLRAARQQHVVERGKEARSLCARRGSGRVVHPPRLRTPVVGSDDSHPSGGQMIDITGQFAHTLVCSVRSPSRVHSLERPCTQKMP